jgi:hypothetical protein
MIQRGTHTVSEETGKHKLGTVAHGIDGAVLNDKTLVGGQEDLEGRDHLAQVRLIARVVHGPLGVQNIMQRNQVLRLVHGTTPHAAKLLHVGADAEEETKMHAEGTDVGTGLTADPEDTEVTVIVKLDELALVNGTDTQLALDGRDERRALEQGTRELLQSLGELGLAAGDLVVEADDADVFLSGALLGLDEARGAIDTDNQAPGDLGIEGTAVAGLLNTAFPMLAPCSPTPIFWSFS